MAAMASKDERERRVGRKLFNDGIATEDEHEYTCDRCGQVERTTVNCDGMRHGLPLPACGGVFHADLRAARVREAAPEAYTVCREVAERDSFDGPGLAAWAERVAAKARKIVDKVEGRAPSAPAAEERRAPTA